MPSVEHYVVSARSVAEVNAAVDRAGIHALKVWGFKNVYERQRGFIVNGHALPLRVHAPAAVEVEKVIPIPAREVLKVKNKPTKGHVERTTLRSTKSIPEQLREETGYIDSARVMKLLGLGETAFYAQIKSGLIPARKWGTDWKIDPFVLADQLERSST